MLALRSVARETNAQRSLVACYVNTAVTPNAYWPLPSVGHVWAHLPSLPWAGIASRWDVASEVVHGIGATPDAVVAEVRKLSATGAIGDSAAVTGRDRRTESLHDRMLLRVRQNHTEQGGHRDLPLRVVDRCGRHVVERTPDEQHLD